MPLVVSCLAAAVWLLAGAGPAAAHALDPSLLELRELGNGAIEVTWRTPVVTLGNEPPRPVLPCEATTEPEDRLSEDGRSLIRTWQMACDRPLAGRQVEVEGLLPSGSETLLRWSRTDGETIQRVLSARQPSLVLPSDPTWHNVAVDYLRFGCEHILQGFDHLAFVFGLFLLVSGRRLVITVTAFTVGHSLTLALVVLGAMTPPSALVETAIAASILVLAVELARRKASETGERAESWLRRRPWTVAGGFGLLHGMGFAGALRETGLPQEEIPLALASFNVGIELGQLVFVAALAVTAALLAPVVRAGLRRLEQPVPVWHAFGRGTAVYALGTIAAYWTLQRLGGVIL